MVIGRIINFESYMNVNLTSWTETIIDIVLLLFIGGIIYFVWTEARKVKEQRAETRLVQKAIKTPGGGRTAGNVWAALGKLKGAFGKEEAEVEARTKLVTHKLMSKEAIIEEKKTYAKNIPGEGGRIALQKLKLEEKAKQEEENIIRKMKGAIETGLKEEQIINREERAAAAVVAGVEDVIGAGEEIVNKNEEILAQEEAEQRKLISQLKKMESFRELNSTTLKYLFGVLQEIKPLLEESARTEEKSLADMESQHNKLKQIIRDLRTIIRYVLPVTRGAKRNPKKMVSNLKEVIKNFRERRGDYERELQIETDRSGDGQNSDQITELQKKINHFDENMPLLNELQRSAEEAEKDIFQQLKELQTAQAAARRIVNSLNRTEKRVDNIKRPREAVNELTDRKTRLIEAIDKLESGSNVLPLTTSVLGQFVELVQAVKKVFAQKPSPQEFYTAVVPLVDSIQEILVKIKKIEHVEQTMVGLLENAPLIVGETFYDDVSDQLEALAGELKKESILGGYEERLDDKLLATLQQAKIGLLAAIRKLEENKRKTAQIATAIEALNATATKIVNDSLVPLLRKKMELKAEYKEKAEEFAGRINQAGGSVLKERIGI